MLASRIITILCCGFILTALGLDDDDFNDDHDFHCPPNQKFSHCANPCQPTCADPQRKPCPTFTCNPGCVCRDGFVKDSRGNCILLRHCPQGHPNPQCGRNEEFVQCPNPCPPTCQKPNVGFCPAICLRSGCQCKKGFLKDPRLGCILPQQCTVNPCGRHEDFVSCPNPCPPTCQNPKGLPGCKRKCQDFGCQCKPGFVRDANNRCIFAQQCPRNNGHCGQNEQWSDDSCVAPPLCQFPQCPNNPQVYCPPICQRGGCVCIPGCMRDKNGKCVFPYQCNRINFEATQGK